LRIAIFDDAVVGEGVAECPTLGVVAGVFQKVTH
jgi:hypothetical protein